jgi:hypothetical protein
MEAVTGAGVALERATTIAMTTCWSTVVVAAAVVAVPLPFTVAADCPYTSGVAWLTPRNA